MQDFLIRATDLLVSPAALSHFSDSALKGLDSTLGAAERRALVLKKALKQGCNESLRLRVWQDVMPLLPSWFEACVQQVLECDMQTVYLEPFVCILGA